MKLSLGRVAEFMAGGGDFDPAATAEGYSIDSRTLVPGELFIAIKGDRFDGHDFVNAALAAGAVAAVVRRDRAEALPDSSRLLLVDDTLAALQQLGACVRRGWGKALLAPPRSARQTTTKHPTPPH